MMNDRIPPDLRPGDAVQLRGTTGFWREMYRLTGFDHMIMKGPSICQDNQIVGSVVFIVAVGDFDRAGAVMCLTQLGVAWTWASGLFTPWLGNGEKL